jgi:lipopolysaccharide transport system permease protein
VYFPRLAVPVSVVITNLITFGIQFSLFLAILAYYYFTGAPVHPNRWVLIVPLLLVEMAMLGLGVGILVSSMTTKYRDMNYLVRFGIQLWMYGTPIVYPLSQVPEKWQWIFSLNPMASIIETYRYAFLGAGSVSPAQMLMSAGITVIILFLGIMAFSRIEKTFMDTV